MFDYMSRRTKKGIPDLNVVPILDMLISVIFFLILTTTFLQLTKESVPPSSVTTITNPVVPPPVAARFICIDKNNKTELILSWSGEHPGQLHKEVDQADPASDDSRNAILLATQDMITQFSNQYPNEKTLQLGLQGRRSVSKVDNGHGRREGEITRYRAIRLSRS